MNNSETIKYFESLLKRFEDKPDDTYWGKVHNATSREALSAALSALREQAEREKGCEYCNSALAPLYKISTNWHPSFALFEPAVCPVCGKRLEVEP